MEHSPGRLIGDLASNAGQFGTAMDLTQVALQAGQQQSANFARQQQQQLEQQRLELAQEHARTDQQDQLDRIQARGDVSLGQQHQRHADDLERLAQQYELQGANQQDVQQMRDEAAWHRQQAGLAARGQWQSDRNQVQQGRYDQQAAQYQQGFDQRQQFHQDQQDLGHYRTDQNNQTRRDLAGARPAPDVAGMAWNRQTRAMNQYVRGLQQEAANLQSAVARDPVGLNPQTAQAAARLAEIRKELDGAMPQLQDMVNNPPAVPHAPAPFEGATPARFGDEIPSLPSDVLPPHSPENVGGVDYGGAGVDYGGAADYGSQSRADYGAADATGLPPEAHQLIQQMVADGHGNMTIKAALAEQFGIQEA